MTVVILMLSGLALLALATLFAADWRPIKVGNRLIMCSGYGDRLKTRSATHAEEQQFINDHASF